MSCLLGCVYALCFYVLEGAHLCGADSSQNGFEEFAPIGQVCGVRNTKNDTMMLKIEISRL